jgi:hypothetical protein
MAIGLSSCTVSAEFEDKAQGVGYQHTIFDVDNVHARKENVVLVVRESDPNMQQRIAVCHIYQFKNKDLAARYSLAVTNKCREGQRRVQQAVQRAKDAATRAETPRTLHLNQAAMGGGGGTAASPRKTSTSSLGTKKKSTSDMSGGSVGGGGGGSGVQVNDKTLKLSSSDGKNITSRSIGARCSVSGYPSTGTIRFVGLHKQNLNPRVGVELDEQVGKNNGIVQGTVYFSCPAGHGLLVAPNKVVMGGGESRRNSLGEEFDGFEVKGIVLQLSVLARGVLF